MPLTKIFIEGFLQNVLNQAPHRRQQPAQHRRQQLAHQRRQQPAQHRRQQPAQHRRQQPAHYRRQRRRATVVCGGLTKRSNKIVAKEKMIFFVPIAIAVGH